MTRIKNMRVLSLKIKKLWRFILRKKQNFQIWMKGISFGKKITIFPYWQTDINTKRKVPPRGEISPFRTFFVYRKKLPVLSDFYMSAHSALRFQQTAHSFLCRPVVLKEKEETSAKPRQYPRIGARAHNIRQVRCHIQPCQRAQNHPRRDGNDRPADDKPCQIDGSRWPALTESLWKFP